MGPVSLLFGRPRGESRELWDRGAPVLLYHRVYAERVPRHDPFGVTRAAFEAQVEWLAERFRLCTVGELVEILDEDGDASTTAAITFDDGYQCTFEEAWPVLRRHAIPATLFVDTSRVDGPRPALSSEEVRTMAEGGMEIASHSVSHVNLTELDAGELADELVDSRAALEAMVERPVTGFAAPYGRYDASTVEAARAAGYRYLCTVRQHQTNASRRGVFLVDRVEVNRGDDTRRLERKLRGDFARVYESWYRIDPSTRHWLSD